MKISEKYSFLFRNLLKGFLWLVAIIAIFKLSEYFLGDKVEQFLKYSGDKYILIFSIYSISELVFGIIPPELFMIWATEQNSIENYILIILLLTVLSYLAGLIGYAFGRFFSSTRIYRYLRRKRFKKLEYYLNRFGGFLVIVAALTPIPFSATSMLVGAAKYPFKSYMLYSLFRFLRFAVYAFIIWEAN